MQKKLSIGLLPLYIALYDRTDPQIRPRAEKFAALIASKLTGLGLDVHTSPLCCVAEQFSRAIEGFEADGVDALVTLHLAYSPSLESELALKRTRLPILVLDTTPDAAFTWDMDHESINDNHGIHGVQDMCSVLKRNGKRYAIVAGHWRDSDVLTRLMGMVRAAAVYTAMHRSKVGLVGTPFQGMGDFNIPESRLTGELGIDVVHFPANDAGILAETSREELEAEWRKDTARCIGVDSALKETYLSSERVGQAVLRWARREGLLGFSMNFLASGCGPAFPAMPFTAAEKGMEEGIGYAGEGDVLGAAFVGALLRAYPRTTFAEMFCPDWAGNRIFFSHMGEMNLRVTDANPRMVKVGSASPEGGESVAIVGRYQPGEACYVNLAPREKGFGLIVVRGEMDALPDNMGTFATDVCGWFKPRLPISELLERYSYAGGTHHGDIVYGCEVAQMETLARLSGDGRLPGWDFTVV